MKYSGAIFLWCCIAATGKSPAKTNPPTNTIEQYVKDADARSAGSGQPTSPGSIFTATGYLANTSRDPRAVQLDDIITILVDDKATAASSGVSNTSRKSSAQYGVTAAYGLRSTGGLPNLLGTNGNNALQGQGQTTRANNLSTTISARVIHVLPNGNMIVEGTKNVTVNSENQLVRVRGIIRPTDVSAVNTVPSDRLAGLEIEINGRGVVGDAVKRPFILYRILLGLLPF